eukprot:5743207-Pleurochrysis_carterae.AAC.1
MPPPPATRTTKIVSSVTNPDGSVTDVQVCLKLHALRVCVGDDVSSLLASCHSFYPRSASQRLAMSSSLNRMLPRVCLPLRTSSICASSSCCASYAHGSL